MGRGGEAGNAPKSSVGAQKTYKLEGLETTELRKWAAKYNEDSTADRAVLLAKLVSIIIDPQYTVQTT